MTVACLLRPARVPDPASDLARLARRSSLAIALLACLSACTGGPTAHGRADAGAAMGERTVQVTRTAYGVAHVQAPDMGMLAYGVAYAHAQDNVCQTAQQLLTIRGERSRFLGAESRGLLGLRPLPNAQIDLFIAAHMNDEALARAAETTSAEAQAMAEGYAAGYNRFLADRAGQLPAACQGQPWVRPMTVADFRRLTELSSVQAGIAALADGMLGAQPPTAQTSLGAPVPAPGATPDPVALAQALRERGLLDSPYGSNAWALGRDSTADGRGLLLGNPHFPWQGVNRFWQMHLSIPGQLDVMGAAIGHGAVVQIGFNRDIAWSHTVSTGKRFTLHALQLVPGDPTRYLVDGQPEAMAQQRVQIQVRQADGSLATQRHTVWRTRWGPVVVIPTAKLAWTHTTAYALQDANTGNARGVDTWLAINRARSVRDLPQALRGLGTPWVNTIAADRHGDAFYGDASVVPDVDAARLKRCAAGPASEALWKAAGLVLLDGARSDCGWHHDAAAPAAGITPIGRLPMAIRSDWLQNSNDSFYYSHPAQRFEGISPLVGDASLSRVRTRSSLKEIPEMLARGKATRQSVQAQLFSNQNLAGQLMVPDLLLACERTPPVQAGARAACSALAGWDRRSDLDSRGAHLFREFWRTARVIPSLYRVPFDPAQPLSTPQGLNLGDAPTAARIWEALDAAATKVQQAGFALTARLADVQRPAITAEPIGLHGGDEIEGVLNNLGDRAAPGISNRGIRIDYGTSYVQTVGFDDRGPVAQAILTYGQSTDPASPHATDQLRLFAEKRWPLLPFHAEDVARARVGEPLLLQRP